MSAFLHQRQQQQLLENPYPISPRSSSSNQKPISFFSRTGLFILLSLVVVLGVFFPWMSMPEGLFSGSKESLSKWKEYTLEQAVSFVAKNGTVIVCAVSQSYLPFLNNWLISISRQKHQEKVLVIAEDYATLYRVNQKWPGHAVLIPPAPDAQTAHEFGTQRKQLNSNLECNFAYSLIFQAWNWHEREEEVEMTSRIFVCSCDFGGGGGLSWNEDNWEAT
ncbi:hypothetical protein HHK36_027612 [Tetracentron sinense]|uniref:Nucleotide-diphospho-sugar transferase domain-containing protein n=1 Tax=Tetracentron sinense TaxID=13715 RepID=A0A834YJF6_TETSI|nr:hypothetical protein HHK36_027612 [Tetracentron sinense]